MRFCNTLVTKAIARRELKLINMIHHLPDKHRLEIIRNIPSANSHHIIQVFHLGGRFTVSLERRFSDESELANIRLVDGHITQIVELKISTE